MRGSEKEGFTSKLSEDALTALEEAGVSGITTAEEAAAAGKDDKSAFYKYINDARLEYNNNGVVCEKKASKIQKFRIIAGPDFDITGNGCLGPTLKLKRPVVNQTFNDLIEEMYAS